MLARVPATFFTENIGPTGGNVSFQSKLILVTTYAEDFSRSGADFSTLVAAGNA